MHVITKVPLTGAELATTLFGGTTTIVDYEFTFVIVAALNEYPKIIFVTETV